MQQSAAELRILVVEDNRGDFLLIKEYLEDEFISCRVLHAGTLHETKLHLKSTPTIILLDLALPDSSGEDLVMEMVKDAGNIPIIVLTGYSDKDFGVKTLGLGVSDYLLKDELTGAQLHKSITYSIERKRISIKLNESEEKYRGLFHLSPLPMWVFDTDSLEFLNVNDAAVRHYGYSRQEFLSMTIKDLRFQGEGRDIIKTVLASKQTDKYFADHVTHRKKHGEMISVHIESNSIEFDGKNARLVLATDITEKLRAETDLIKSENRFKALVQDSADVIAILDREANYQYVSPSSQSIVGLPPDFFMGRNAFDFIHEDDRSKVKHQFELLTVQKRIKTPPFRFRGLNRDHWLETIITDMTNDPAVSGIVANSTDVTLRIENEIKIKEGLERYNIVSKATSDAIYDWDFASHRVVWNQGLTAIFGHKYTGSLTHQWWHEHVHPEDVARVNENFQSSISKRRSRCQNEYRFLSADGSYKYVLDRSFLVYDKDMQPLKMIGSLQDITEQINYIRAIEDQNARLREIAWFQSHVVRAPLSRIMGLIDILKNHPEDKDRAELLGHILTSAHELDDVVRSIINRAAEAEKYGEMKLDGSDG